MISALEALEQLRAGNRRFAADEGDISRLSNRVHRSKLVAGQEPFAVVLACSDARVPTELVFDQRLGDLFSIRIAGNIVAPSQIASVEFAVEMFGTRLVVVLGHSGCGAVSATLDHLGNPKDFPAANLRSIIDRIRPAVEPLLDSEKGEDREALLAAAVRSNIRASASHLRHASPILEQLEEDGLLVLGAEYSLKTGVVTFFDGLPIGHETD